MFLSLDLNNNYKDGRCDSVAVMQKKLPSLHAPLLNLWAAASSEQSSVRRSHLKLRVIGVL